MSLARTPSLGPVHADSLATVRGLVSSAWHGLWNFAFTSPWIAIALMIPAVALLVRFTRVGVRKD